MEKKTILTLEQALTLPYATERFAQLGWRVIRIETPGNPGQKRPGDPNRYIGEDTGIDDLHAYFMAPNLGKEAITLNLKKEKDQQHINEGRMEEEMTLADSFRNLSSFILTLLYLIL